MLKQAHKSLTAAFAVVGGVFTRPDLTLVKNGAQIADRSSIIWLSEKQKGLDSALSQFVKSTKTESETL